MEQPRFGSTLDDLRAWYRDNVHTIATRLVEDPELDQESYIAKTKFVMDEEMSLICLLASNNRDAFLGVEPTASWSQQAYWALAEDVEYVLATRRRQQETE